MASITLRSVKGSPLTNAELDANFANLNTELAEKLGAVGGALTGNLTFSGTGLRIVGDLSSAATSRLAFQTSTANGQTLVTAIPNGTGVNSQFQAFNSSDPANSSIAALVASSSQVRIVSGNVGTGALNPITFIFSNTEAARFVPGTLNFLIGTSTDDGVNKLQVAGRTGLTANSSSAALTVTQNGTGDVVQFYKPSSANSIRITSNNNLLLGNSFPTGGGDVYPITVINSGIGAYTYENFGSSQITIGRSRYDTDPVINGDVIGTYWYAARGSYGGGVVGHISLRATVEDALFRSYGSFASPNRGVRWTVGYTPAVSELPIDLFSVASSGGIAFNGQFGSPGQVLQSNGSLLPPTWVNAPASGVTSFNSRTGAITLTSSDVTTALGYTPGGGGSLYTRGFVFSGTTSSNTETELFVNGVANSRIEAPATGRFIAYRAEFIGRRDLAQTSAINDAVYIVVYGVAEVAAGSFIDVGNLYEQIVVRSDMLVSIDVRAEGSNLRVYVQGPTGKTYLWRVVVSLNEV